MNDPVFRLLSVALLLAAGCTAQTKPQASTDPIEARAQGIVAQMTLDEKIAQLHGIRDAKDYRVVPGLPRLGIPALTVTNGPAGAGPAGPGHEGKATALPAPISLAATWDIDAARSSGEIAGSDAAALGNLLLESPDINIARTPHNGRTFESFGEDPYLSGQLAAANVRGIQSQGIIANVKHFAGNNQEQDRLKVNDDIDPRTLREIYLPAFETAVKQGHVASLMAAYNKVNGFFCCENDFLLNHVLKGEWGFQGFVTSDFGAVHSTIPSALAGLDLEMPTGIYFGDALKQSVESGQISVSLLNEKLVRRFATMMRMGLWDSQPPRKPIDPAHAAMAMKLAAEGMVLLKNTGNELPLRPADVHSIALIGPFSAEAMTGGGGSSHVSPILTVSPSEGIRNILGPSATIQHVSGRNVQEAVALAKSVDVAILMLGDRQTEGVDHPIILGQNQNALAAAILAANPHTIVVLKTGGPVLMPWVTQAPAILEAWYPGEEDGAAVASVLFGQTNPSGKLPITFPMRDEDLPTQSRSQYPGVNNIAHYSEGLLVGYRWYDAKNIAPLFPFGFGLSYTTFGFSDLKVSAINQNLNATVSFTVTNTGNCAGAEVAQLYISFPPEVSEPPRLLKGFSRVELDPGKSANVTITLYARSFSYWNVPANAWKVASGTYSIWVGPSSRDIQLTETISIPEHQ